MQRRKIVIATLSLLLVGLALPSVPRAHAFHTGGIAVTTSGIIMGVTDPSSIGAINAAQVSSAITFTVLIQTSGFTPSYQRNVTFGVKTDWMTAYQNSSSYPLASNSIGSATLSITAPAAGGPFSPIHTSTIAVWDGPSTGTNTASCAGGGADAEKTPACVSTPGPSFRVYSSDQFAALQARSQAQVVIGQASGQGIPAAEGQLNQASTEQALGDSSWRNGDYSGARSHYQNALSDANAAEATVVNQGGGAINADIVNAIMVGTGQTLIGIGILLAGIGAFLYFRRRPKA